jgi:hypothetical protein
VTARSRSSVAEHPNQYRRRDSFPGELKAEV